MELMRLRRKMKGCSEFVCRKEDPHNQCEICGRLTCRKTIGVDSKSLRRKRVWVCSQPCFLIYGNRNQSSRTKRTKDDWEKLSTAIEHKLIEPERMPEQYAGQTRAAIRAFIDSGADVALVPFSSPETLQVSINTLGLHKEVYAEKRDNQTVIRRIELA